MQLNWTRSPAQTGREDVNEVLSQKRSVRRAESSHTAVQQFCKKNYYAPIATKGLETVTVCNHWNLLEYNYTCTSADAWNAYLSIAAWTAFSATTIWAGYNFDRASYLHVSSRASIYKPLGWLRPRSDKTPRGIFKYSAEHGPSTQVLYTLHVKVQVYKKNFKVYDILKLAIVEQSSCNSACIGRSMHSQTIHI